MILLSAFGLPRDANHVAALETRDITTATNGNPGLNRREFNPTLSARSRATGSILPIGPVSRKISRRAVLPVEDRID